MLTPDLDGSFELPAADCAVRVRRGRVTPPDFSLLEARAQVGAGERTPLEVVFYRE